MVKEILTRIENLHDFIEDCLRDDDGVTLLDKDVILDNLREIYMLSRRIEIVDSIDQSQIGDDNSGVVLFDNSVDVIDEPQCETQSEEIESNQDCENIDIESEIMVEQIDAVQLSDIDDDQDDEPTQDDEDDQDDEPTQDDQPNQEIEAVNLDIDLFEHDSFEKEDRELMISSLFDGDSEKYLNFVDKINEFDDFDEAIIYTYELFGDRPTDSSIDIIVAYLEKRLN